MICANRQHEYPFSVVGARGVSSGIHISGPDSQPPDSWKGGSLQRFRGEREEIRCPKSYVRRRMVVAAFQSSK